MSCACGPALSQYAVGGTSEASSQGRKAARLQVNRGSARKRTRKILRVRRKVRT